MFTEYICFSLHYDYKLTNFTVALFSWTTQSYLRYHLSDSSRIRHNDSQLYIYGSLLLLEYSLQLKNLLKNNKNRCHEGKSWCNFQQNNACLLRMLQYSSNIPCLFAKNILIWACLFTFHRSRYLHLLHSQKHIHNTSASKY